MSGETTSASGLALLPRRLPAAWLAFLLGSASIASLLMAPT